MSVYKFMAGMVESIVGNEENFDPHLHRIIKHPTSYLDTMTHLLKGSLGAGILAMPYATAKLGILYSTIVLVSVGCFAAYCIQLLIDVQYKLCKRHKRGYMAYPKSMLYAIKDGPPFLKSTGKFFYWFVDVTLIFWQLGICTIYFVFVSENLKQILEYHGKHFSLRILLVYIFLPTLLLNLVKNLKLLSPLSTTSNGVTLVGFMLVSFYLVEDDLDIGAEKWKIKSFGEIPGFVGTSLFALEAVGVVLALEYNMENPKEFVGLFGLFNIGMSIIIMLYLLSGIFGYLKYGDKIQASITLNLPADQKKAQAAKLLMALAIYLSIPLQNFVAYNIIWRRISKKFREDAAKSSIYTADMALRVALVVIPWVAAILCPNLGPIISFIGALCLSLLSMVFPGLMSICLLYSEPDQYGYGYHKLIRDIMILCTGFVILVSGVFTSILEICES